MDLSSLGRRERRWLQLGGYVLFFVCSFLLLCYLLFPFNRWKGTLEELMSRQLDRKVTIGSVGSWGVTGLKLRDVTIEKVEEDEEPEAGIFEKAADKAGVKKKDRKKKEKKKRSIPLHIDRLGLRVALLPLVTGKMGVCFDARLFDGVLKGCYVDASRSILGGRRDGPPSEDDPRSGLDVKIRGIDLREIAQLEDLVGLPFNGVVEGDVDLSYVAGLPRTAEGDVELRIEDLRVGEKGGKIDLSKAGGVLQGEITFEPIVVGDLVLEMKGESGILEVENLKATSQHVQIRGGGDMSLRQPLMLSVMNIYVMFKFQPAYTDKSSMTKTIFSALDRLPKMRKAKRPDGFFGYLLKGNMKNGPQFVPSRSGPTPSPQPGGPGAGKKKGSGLPMGLGKKQEKPKKPRPAKPPAD